MKKKKSSRSPFSSNEQKVAYKIWRLYVEDITNRENFAKHHLLQLETLCKLYQEVEDLEESLKITGTSIENHGRYGLQVRSHPDVLQKNKCLAEIRAYTKMLGLGISKNEKEDDDDGEFT